MDNLDSCSSSISTTHQAPEAEAGDNPQTDAQGLEAIVLDSRTSNGDWYSTEVTWSLE